MYKHTFIVYVTTGQGAGRGVDNIQPQQEKGL